ncbi:MAG: putative Zn finger protein, partial [Kiritimatiellia bacterium]
MSGTGPRFRAPDDGIVMSNRRRDWPSQRWMASFDKLNETHHNQLVRGRTLARSGRVRDLWFSPGLGSAEVVSNKGDHRVNIRVRVFDELEWEALVRQLLSRLEHIASMLEGNLPETLVTELEAGGLPLLPTLNDIDGVCECQDFHMPCSHMAAVHNVIADALDGDPFLLLTLRGLNREQLMARLRQAWNDPRPMRAHDIHAPQPPPNMGDWDVSPEPIERLRVPVSLPADARPGVCALGPPPGQADLNGPLLPLYQAGSNAAYEAAIGDGVAADVPVRGLWQGFQTGNKSSTPYDPTAPDVPVP